VDLRGWIAAEHASLRDRLFDGIVSRVPTDRWSEQADGGGSSIAWLLLHVARHQDLAVTTAIRDHQPLFASHRTALALDGAAAWAGLPEREDRGISLAVDPDRLVEYLAAVFDATDRWQGNVDSMALDTIPDTSERLERLAGITADDVDWLHRMWHERPVWWLVQWPVIGHGNAHVGEATSVRNRLGFSPF
jgi:hypothetical protein